MNLINSDNINLRYSGRIDFSDSKKPMLIYAGSMVRVNFTGTSVSAVIENIKMSEKCWFGFLVDNIQYKAELLDGEQTYLLAENLPEGEHTLVIFKRQAAAYYMRLCGLVLDDGAEVMPADSFSPLKLEIYGDSVSAGEVSEAVNYVAHQDPENHKGEYDNCWFSYTMSLARKLNADINNCSQGGISLFSGTGYFYGPDHLTGLEDTFDKLSYVPYSPMGYTSWDFSEYIPDYVIVAIGQNDPNPNPEAIKEPAYARRWKDKYEEILNTLRNHYPDAKFILITTLLMHDIIWDDKLDEICEEMNDKNIRRYKFRRNGAATPGHPRIPEQEEMAEELRVFIQNEFSE